MASTTVETLDLPEVEDILDDVRILLDAIQMGAETLGRRGANALTKLASVTNARLGDAIAMMAELRGEAPCAS